MGLLDRLLGSIHRVIAPPAFVVEVHGDGARVERGDIPPGLLNGLADVVRDLGIANGKIYGMHGQQGITLRFSDDIPAHSHQRLRNVLALHRHRIKRRVG